MLINQSTVLEQGGLPFAITQPGIYKLSGNLTVPIGTNGINVTAPNVTLDLDGFSISGGSEPISASSLTTGIYGTGSCTRGGPGVAPAISTRCVSCAQVSVRNGVVTGFGIGIFVDCVGSSIQHTLVTNTNTGITTPGYSPPFSGTAAALITGNFVNNTVPDDIQTNTFAGGRPCKGSNNLGWEH